MKLIAVTAIGVVVLVGGCSSSSPSHSEPSVSESATTASSQPPITSSPTPTPSPTTATSSAVKLTEKGLVKAGYFKVSSADPTETAKYYVRTDGVYTTAWADLGKAQELVGVRLEIAADPDAKSSTSVDADEYSPDDNNAVINDLLEDTDAAAIAKVCGPYPPLQKAEAAAGIARSTKITNNSIGIYPLAVGGPTLKGCLIFEDDPGVQHHKVWFDPATETDPALTVPSKDGIAIWSGTSEPVS
jgi:hypothetical protein